MPTVWWFVRHSISPDWVTTFHDQHPFWTDFLITTLSGMTVTILVFAAYLVARWFFRLTDVTVGYSWCWAKNGLQCSPSFDIRNRAGSKLYTLDSIKYSKAGAVFWIDNDSLMGKELKPETRHYIKGEDVAPVKNMKFEHLMVDGKLDPAATKNLCDIEVTVRDQMGREFPAVGPGQLAHRGRWRTFLHRIHPFVKAVSPDSV
jgi:hypothetical protein